MHMANTAVFGIRLSKSEYAVAIILRLLPI
jgi:hypothetical protein